MSDSVQDDAFLGWWYAPWPADADAGPVAERDRYRRRCAEAGMPAQLPADAEAAWRAVLTSDGAALAATARLFGGLLAARGDDQAALQALEPHQRLWCASIAATQPLALCAAGAAAPPQAPDAAVDEAAARGLAHLACRLEQGHAGLWPRLRRCLPPPLAQRADALAATLVAGPLSAAALARLLRCWHMCRHQAASIRF